MALFVAYLLRVVLLPFVFAGAVAFVARPFMDRAHDRWRVPRWASGILVLLLFTAFLGGFAYWVESLLATEVPRLVTRLPEILHGLIDRFLGGQSFQLLGQTWNADTLTQKAVDTLKASIDPQTAVMWGASVFAMMFAGVLTVVLAAYLIFAGPTLARGALWLVPPRHRPTVHAVACRIAPMLRRYIVGVVLVVLYTAGVAWLGFYFAFHLPHALLLASAVGLLEMIPVVGPIAAAGLVGANAVQATSLFTAVALVAFAIGLRISIDEFVGPFVLGKAASVHPVVVIFAFLAGSVLFGILGLLLAVPTAASVKIVLAYLYEEREGAGRLEG